MKRILVAAVVALTLPTIAMAAEAAAPDLKTPEGKSQFLASLSKRSGEIDVPQAKARLALGDKYYFLGPDDSRKVIVDAWRNPKDAADGVIGMVFAAGATPFDEDSWGAVVSYEDTGYVSDADARKTDYDKVLKQLREGEDQDNEARRKDGFSEIHLVGWAQPPTYDAAHHSLVWARDLHFGDQKEDTLNYDLRVLGRRGVLSLNVVSSMNQTRQIGQAADALQQVTAFDPGSRYADYKQGVDKRAEYGLAGLVLAGAGLVVAKKAGLLVVALLFLKKGIAVIVAGGAALWAGLKRRFAKKKPAP